jgi:hypothetical protein
LYDPNTVYVALDNHKYGDFEPYLIKSTNLGRSWTSLADDLPENHLVWRIVQDHVNKDLLFIGTEFGVFFTVDGGKKWIELEGGMPTISTRDIVIQRRENDLVVGTFGRGIYILDDYSPLRELTEEAMEQDALLFAPSRPVKWFKLDDNHSDTDGDDRYAAENPEHGATLTYFLKESLLTTKEKRKDAEKALVKAKKYPKYPAWEAIEKENQEPKPAVYLEIRNASGEFINRVEGDVKKGLHRVTWNMNYANSSAIISGDDDEDFRQRGLMAAPGTYTAALYQRVGSDVTQLADAVEFELKPIYTQTVPGPTTDAALEFGKKIKEAQRRSSAINAALEEMETTMETLRSAIDVTPGDISGIETQYAAIQAEINAINFELGGLESRERLGIKPANINSRLRYSYSALWTSYGPTAQHIEQFGFAMDGLNDVSTRLKSSREQAIPQLQQAIVNAGGPWTSGAPVISN